MKINELVESGKGVEPVVPEPAVPELVLVSQ
jgi:hypothetical protein